MLNVQETKGIHFEPVTRNSVLELKHISESIYYETFRAHNTPENMQAYLESAFNTSRLLSELADPANAYFFVKNGRGIIGYIKLQHEFDRSDETIPACVLSAKSLLLDRFYLHPDHHGTGIAHCMMQFCLDTAKAQGAAFLWLGVWENNIRAQAFYKKWKFVVVGQHLFHMGNDAQTDYWMAHRLA